MAKTTIAKAHTELEKVMRWTAKLPSRRGSRKKNRNLRTNPTLNTKTMMTEGKHEGASPEEEDKALWSLLERAPRPKPVSPYFARRVLREVNALAENPPVASPAPGWLAGLWRSWQGQGRGVFAGALGAVALLAAGAGLSPLRWHSPAPSDAATHAVPTTVQEPEGNAPEVQADSPSPLVVSDSTVTAQDVEVIADLDNLLSHEESRLWTEDDTARF